MLDMYELDGVIHPAYAGVRKRTIEGLRADLSHVLTGMLHLKELEACVPGVFPKAGAKATDDDQAMP